jgi:hypothetical protein
LIPFVVFLTVVGILQPLAMVVLWFRKNRRQDDWRAMKYFTLATVVLLYVLFLFSLKSPMSGTFYVTLPVAMLYSLYCWSDFLQNKSWQRFAMVFIVSGIIFHAGLAVHNFKTVSIYVDRRRVVEAIDTKDYHKVGERREGSRY